MRKLIVLITLAVLAACSGSHTAAPLPASQTPTAPSGTARTPATLTIHIPATTATTSASAARRPSYVSPATTQALIDIQQNGSSIPNYPQTVPLTPTSTGCSSTLVGTQCQLSLALSGGAYTMSLTLMDAANNSLAQTRNIPFTIVNGQANQINLTLGGVASSVVIIPVTPHRMKGSATTFTLYGNQPIAFDAYPVDIDGNIIVGPGSPTPSLTLTSTSNATLSAPASSNPNQWTITPNYQPSNPTIPATTALTVSVAPAPNSGAAAISSSVHLSIYQPWIYVVDQTAGSILTFTEDGSLISTTAFSGGALATLQANGLAYGNGVLYVLGAASYNAEISNYALTGGPALKTVTKSTTNFGALGTPAYPNGLTYDAHNQQLYLGDLSYSTLTLQSYDAALDAGLQNSTTGQASYGDVYIPATNQIAYVGTAGGVILCSESLSCNQFTGTLNNFGIAWDPDDQYIGLDQATCCSPGGIALYDTSGNSVAQIALGINGERLAYDPYAGYWLIFSGTISTFSTSGASIATQNGFSAFPSGHQTGGIIVVP